MYWLKVIYESLEPMQTITKEQAFAEVSKRFPEKDIAGFAPGHVDFFA